MVRSPTAQAEELIWKIDFRFGVLAASLLTSFGGILRKLDFNDRKSGGGVKPIYYW
jgi:hypothetical protein